MALRSNYSSLDMIRMAKFAKANPDLKPIPLIQEYNKKYPEISEAQKRENIRNWLNDTGLIERIENESCEGKPDTLKSGNCNIADVTNPVCVQAGGQDCIYNVRGLCTNKNDCEFEQTGW